MREGGDVVTGAASAPRGGGEMALGEAVRGGWGTRGIFALDPQFCCEPKTLKEYYQEKEGGQLPSCLPHLCVILTLLGK